MMKIKIYIFEKMLMISTYSSLVHINHKICKRSHISSISLIIDMFILISVHFSEIVDFRDYINCKLCTS